MGVDAGGGCGRGDTLAVGSTDLSPLALSLARTKQYIRVSASISSIIAVQIHPFTPPILPGKLKTYVHGQWLRAQLEHWVPPSG